MDELVFNYRGIKLGGFRFYADQDNKQKFAQMIHSDFWFPPSLNLFWESVSDTKDAPLGRYKMEWQGKLFEFEARESEAMGLADLLNRHGVANDRTATFNITDVTTFVNESRG